MKENGKEITIENIIIIDYEEEKKKNYMTSYRYGFGCGYDNLKFEDSYNKENTEVSLDGFKDGYRDGIEYRKQEFTN